jgi:hypothetical protein
MKPMRRTLGSWILPVVVAAITLTILNAVERSAGFGPASILGVGILLVVVILFFAGRKQG